MGAQGIGYLLGMDPRNALSHLTRRTAGMLIHPRQGVRDIAGDVKDVLGAGVGVAGHLVGGMVGGASDRGRRVPDDGFDMLTDPRPAAEARTESTKVQGDPVTPISRARRTTSAPVAKVAPTTPPARTTSSKPAPKPAPKPASKAATPKPASKATTPKPAPKAATPKPAPKAAPKPKPPTATKAAKTATPKPKPPKKASKATPSTKTAPSAPSRGQSVTPEPEEITTPSGIPAAEPGHNPSTGKATDLVQPDTEPIVAASTSKAIRKEAEMMRKAASTQK